MNELINELMVPRINFSFTNSQSKREPLITSVLQYIKSKKKPKLNTLLIDKCLYIIVGTHGSMLTNDYSYKTIKIPSNLSIYRLPQTQYGVCSYNDTATKKYMYETLLYHIPEKDILTPLESISRKLFDYNDQLELNMIQPKDPLRYSHFRQYTKDNIPEISYFKGNDIMMDKVIIIEIYVKSGKLVVEDNIFIVHPSYSFEDSISLLDYIDPFLYNYNNGVLYLHYKLADIIKYVQHKKVKSLIMIDLSCSSGNKDNTFKILEDATRLEKKQIITETVNGKIIPQRRPVVMSKSRRLVNKFTAQHTRRRTGQRSYFNKNEMFYPPINVLSRHQRSYE
jgi:hypothetical protein